MASVPSLTAMAWVIACGGGPVGKNDGDTSSSSGPEPTTIDPTQGMSQSSSSPGTTVAPDDDTASDEDENASSSEGSSDTTLGSSDTTDGEANSPPVANGENWTTHPGDVFVVEAELGVLLNDADADGDALSVIGYDAVSHFGGAVVMTSEGGVSYQSPPEFTGVDRFAYTISDGTDASQTWVLMFVYP